MDNDLDTIFDECIDRINRGESFEACLADYPGYAEQLGPLLQAVFRSKEAYSFVPSPGAKREARQRFSAAVQESDRRREQRQPMFPRLLGWSKVWATATAVLLVAIIGYFGLRPLLLPEGLVPQPSPPAVTPVPEPGPPVVTPVPQPSPPVVTPVPQPSPEGYFVFLISDDVNAIGDFESVDISISKIGLLLSGSEGWLEFEPELTDVDLTLVQGDKTQEVWRGNVPEGEYTKVFIQVAGVRGILKETGEEVDIKLPSQKLQMSKRFQVGADELTSFTYDLTVVAAGSPQSGIKYILKPQVDQSGADHKPSKPNGKGKGKER